MAIPATAVVWPESLDPSDVLDFYINCAALVETNETIASYTVIPGPESVLLGLRVDSTAISGSIIRAWLSVDPAKALEFVQVTSLPVEISLTMSSNRKWQRTVVIKVGQK